MDFYKMRKRKNNGDDRMERWNKKETRLGRWSDDEAKKKRKKKQRGGTEAQNDKGKAIDEGNEQEYEYDSGDVQEYVKKKRKKKQHGGTEVQNDKGKAIDEGNEQEYEHESGDEQEYVSFSELASISAELGKMAEISEGLGRNSDSMAKEMVIRSRELEEFSEAMAKKSVDIAKEMKNMLEGMKMELGEVTKKSEEFSKMVGEMIEQMKNNSEKVGERSDYVAKKSKEMAKNYEDLSIISVNLFNKSKAMRLKSQELRMRLEAMEVLAENGVKESTLCKLGWATQHEATDALIAMNRLLLSDEAYTITNEHQVILQDEKHKQQLQLLQSRKEYKDYMKDLVEGEKANKSIGDKFLEQGRADMSKMVMVRDMQEYDRMKTESNKIGTFPQCVVVPALPESVPVLKYARTEGCTVLLYLKQAAVEFDD